MEKSEVKVRISPVIPRGGEMSVGDHLPANLQASLHPGEASWCRLAPDTDVSNRCCVLAPQVLIQRLRPAMPTPSHALPAALAVITSWTVEERA